MAVILRDDEVALDLTYEKGINIRIGINDATCGASEVTMGHTVVPPGNRNPAHYHATAEVGMFILSGRLNVYIGEERHKSEVGAGCFVFVPKGEIHGIENPSQTEPAALIFAYGNVPNKEACGTVFVEEPWVK